MRQCLAAAIADERMQINPASAVPLPTERQKPPRYLSPSEVERLVDEMPSQSAGKRHGNKWLTAMLVEAAGSVGRMTTRTSGRQARRLTRRHGMGRAQVAVARSILGCAYWMLTRDLACHDLGLDWHERRNNEAHTRRLIAS